jgi:ATP-binding cassette subfamily B protein
MPATPGIDTAVTLDTLPPRRGAVRLFADVARYTARQWGRHKLSAGLALLVMMAATLVDIAIPAAIGRLVDALSEAHAGGADLDAAIGAGAAMIALGFAYLVLRHLGMVAICRFTPRVMTRMCQEAFWRVQRFSTDWHANSFAGATVRKLTRGMWAMDMLVDVVILGLVPSLIVLGGATLVLALRWPVLGLAVGLGSLLFIAMCAVLVLRWVAPVAQAANALDSKLGGLLADSVGCNAVVKAFGAERREDRMIADFTEGWRAKTQFTWIRGTTSGTIQLLYMLVLQALVLTLIVGFWLDGRATVGDVAWVLGTYAVIHGYLREIGMHFRNLQRSVNDLEDIVAFVGQAPGVEDRPGATTLVVPEGRIAFDRVTFRYGGQSRALYEDFSVTIAPGERIGLVGHSGSGKSTFVKLIQRLHDVEGGAVRIDGQDVATVTQESLRGRIALVPQEPVLFHRSLAENIAYGKPGAPMEAIVEAARKAHAHGFIASLPQGYDTLVGERGVKLSGGERQRVALARAILADAPILILDEATSSLDSVSEALIQEAVEGLMRNRTTIIVAHRLSTVQRVDRILVFEGGRIVEQGTHAQLIAREGGHYRALFETQTMGLLGERAAA